MADETSTTTTEAAPEAAQSAPEPAGAAQADQTLGESGKAALDAERKARRDAERQLKTLNEQLKGYEDANKTELQKAADRAAAAEQAASQWQARFTDSTIRAAVTDAAVAASAIDPATIYALIRDGISLDDDGNPQGIEKSIGELRKSKSFLFSTTPGLRDAHAGGNNFALNDGDALTKAVLGAVGVQTAPNL